MTAGRIFTYFDIDRVVTSQPFDEAIAEEVERTSARRAFLLVGGTLSRETDTVDRIRARLKDRLAGQCNRMGAHTPINQVVDAANQSARGESRSHRHGRGRISHRRRQTDRALSRQRH